MKISNLITKSFTGFIASPGVLALGRGQNDSAIILFAMGSVDEVILREIANFKSEVWIP